MTKSVKQHILHFLARSIGAAILVKLSLNSLYHSVHAVYSQKLSLNPLLHSMHSQKLSLKGVFKTGIVFIIAKIGEIKKTAHLAFSSEIYWGCHIGKTLFKTLFITLHVLQKLSLSANSTYLTFSREICGDWHIGKFSLSRQLQHISHFLTRFVGAAMLEKLSLSLCTCCA